MQLLTILISLGFSRLWDGANPLQRDDWYWRWLNFLETDCRLDNAVARLVLAVATPVLALIVTMAVVGAASYWLLLPLGVAILLYSLGRATMSDAVDAYTSACACNNWQFGVEQAATLGIDGQSMREGDWSELHQKVVQAAAYRGFERTFAVLFWFLLLGPVGALLYRLSWLYESRAADLASSECGYSVASRWLWMLEWPAVRLTGISFAITGNFVGCFRRWRQCVVCASRSSGLVLYESVVGALFVDDSLLSAPQFTRRELSALRGLYRRTFWLWLGIIGVWNILG